MCRGRSTFKGGIQKTSHLSHSFAPVLLHMGIVHDAAVTTSRFKTLIVLLSLSAFSPPPSLVAVACNLLWKGPDGAKKCLAVCFMIVESSMASAFVSRGLGLF